jgi:hypothetical protein
MKLSENPAYKAVFTSKVHNVTFYMPADIANGYHTSRHVAAVAQDVFSGGGSTRDYLRKVALQVLSWCNEEKNMSELRTNVSAMMQNLLYRTDYPVDELCSIRMGAIYTIMEGEDPDAVQDYWTQQKIILATGSYERNIKADGELYTFFLSTGIQFTPSYKESSLTSIDTTYFNIRREALEGILPHQFRNG